MKTLPASISSRIASRVQTKAAGNNPSNNIWIARPSTPLTDSTFLEKQTILSSDASDISIAVGHPMVNHRDSTIYLAYIRNGTLKVQHAQTKLAMNQHAWVEDSFSESASKCAIAFDGTTPGEADGTFQFVTNQYPWVFWINNGSLYGKELNSNRQTQTLAVSNCTDVSAVRACWNAVNKFNFGLIVFFIMNGLLYYRQFIDEVWYDAEAVNFGPSGISWSEVAASRTWDYRVAVQAKATNGNVYELFTQFEGIGSRNQEHLAVTNVNLSTELTAITYHSAKSSDEHLSGTATISQVLTYGLSSIPISVVNVDDGTGNFGRVIRITFDYPISGVSSNVSAFTLVDQNGANYAVENANVDATGKICTISFTDFNMAAGLEMTVSYTQGTIMSPVVLLNAFNFVFEPTGLIAPQVDPPEPVSIWNE